MAHSNAIFHIDFRLDGSYKCNINWILTLDWLAHTNAIFDIDWMPGEAQLLTASGDQTIALWDVENEKKTCTFGGHKSSVKSVRFQDDSKGYH